MGCGEKNGRNEVARADRAEVMPGQVELCRRAGPAVQGGRQAGGPRSSAALGIRARPPPTSKRRADSDTPIDSSKSRAPANRRSASDCTHGEWRKGWARGAHLQPTQWATDSVPSSAGGGCQKPPPPGANAPPRAGQPSQPRSGSIQAPPARREGSRHEARPAGSAPPCGGRSAGRQARTAGDTPACVVAALWR